MIRQFDSIAALRADAIRSGAFAPSERDRSLATWYGNETLAETLQYSLTGDRRYVANAERLLDALATEINVPRREWERAPVGPFCVVPDVLAGLPTPMRRSRERGDEFAPITILVRPNAHAAVTADMLAKRGTAILALTLALSRIRPISLQYFHVTQGTHQSIDGCSECVLLARIETAPLDVAQASYVLCSAGLYRRLFAHVKALGGHVGQLISLRRSETIAHELLGFDPANTLVIGPADITDPMLTDPVAWLNAQIARFTSQEEDQ